MGNMIAFSLRGLDKGDVSSQVKFKTFGGQTKAGEVWISSFQNSEGKLHGR